MKNQLKNKMIFSKKREKRKTNREPWTLKVALRSSSVLLVCFFVTSAGTREIVSLLLWLSSAPRSSSCGMALGGTCLRGSGFRW